MARKRALSDEKAVELFDYIRHGHHSYSDAAKKFGVSDQTASRYYREVLRKRGKQMQATGGVRVVAVRGVGDEMTFDVERGYVAHAIVGGVEHDEPIEAFDDTDATAKFDEWMRSVNADREELERLTEPAPVPEIKVERWRERAEALEAELAERETEVVQLMAANEALGKELDGLRDRVAELESQSSGSMPDTIYAVLIERPSVKGFGYYTDMDAACAKVAEMNEMAAWLGNPDSIDVHELQRRE